MLQLLLLSSCLFAFFFFSTTELKMNYLIKFILLRSDPITRAKNRHKHASISTNCLVARFIDVSNCYLGGTAKYLNKAHHWGRFLRISTTQTTLSTMLFIMVIGPSGVQFCLQSQVWLQTELDDTKSCYQLIKTITKFEKETRHRLYNDDDNNNNKVNSAKSSVHFHRHNVLTVPLTVQLHGPITNMSRTMSS